ncbi:hypothetical protein KEH51_23285 [[Brevibacterium] frigoritolerans]|uniref:Uncharacterized protein n=1 Tax=Peribacillus frigoritolerans TaxID=450367 RepID=A0A941FJG0_9BACI|nr:hypothetical protein [Peribacillus frigoritolerans]
MGNSYLFEERKAFSPQLSILGRQSAERERISEGGMCKDFHSRHSLSAGGRGASSAFACGVSLDALLPQESRTFRSNQLDFFLGNIVGKLALLSIRL